MIKIQSTLELNHSSMSTILIETCCNIFILLEITVKSMILHSKDKAELHSRMIYGKNIHSRIETFLVIIHRFIISRLI